MLKRLFDLLVVGFLVGQLLCIGCAQQATLMKPAYKSYQSAVPLPEGEVEALRRASPKDAVLVDLLQAFALMRTKNVADKSVQKSIKSHLLTAYEQFEDLRDPINFSKAFTVDEQTPYRGRPHERVFTAVMLGIFEMADGRCDMALPLLRNAEYLSARWQKKTPFGTDAPLVYALMLRCLVQTHKSESDIRRAQDGLFRSIRFLTLQGPLLQGLAEVSKADARSLAVSNRLAYLMFEVGLYNALMGEANEASASQLIRAAASQSELFLANVEDQFADDYNAKIKPLLKDVARLSNKKQKALESWTFQNVRQELFALAEHLERLFEKNHHFHKALAEAQEKVQHIYGEVKSSAIAPRLAIQFSGKGPLVVREGSYGEIARLVTSPDGDDRPDIRSKDIEVSLGCGFHRSGAQGMTVVLCDPKVAQEQPSQTKKILAYRLGNLSREAKMMGGRHFERILRGRAEFRAATEDIAHVGTYSAFILFHIAAETLDKCRKQEGDEACYSAGYAMMAVACLTAVFSGTAWLLGRVSNPAADSRFVPLMYDSAWFGIMHPSSAIIQDKE